jgi:hypothetical protein
MFELAEKKATHDFILSSVLSLVVAQRDYRAYLITPREKHIMCISRISSDITFVLHQEESAAQIGDR